MDDRIRAALPTARSKAPGRPGGAGRTCDSGWPVPHTPRRVRFWVTALILALMWSMLPAAATGALGQQPADRIGSDTDVVEAAIAVSQQTWSSGGAARVVIGRDDVFADSLGGTGLAGTGGPLLFATPDRPLSAALAGEIRRVLGTSSECSGGTDVYLLGGIQALSGQLEDQLVDEGWCVTRLAGPTRVETAAEVALEMGLAGGSVLVARADDWADAATGGAWAAAAGIPVLLTDTDRLPEATADELIAGGYDHIHVLGGTAAVSEDVVRDLSSYATVTRVHGASRDATAVAIARTSGAISGSVYAVNGYHVRGWAYALAAAIPAAMAGAPVVYVDSDSVGAATLGLLGEVNCTRGIVVGPESLVSEDVALTLENNCGGPQPPVEQPAPEEPVAVDPPPEESAPPAPVVRSGLEGGELLHPGEHLTSDGGRHVLAMQTDGNLVLYTGGAPRWATDTDGIAPQYLAMQTDGNLVLYAAGGTPIWSTFTDGQPGSHVRMQSDGNIVVHRGSSPVWQSDTVEAVAPPPGEAPPGSALCSRRPDFSCLDQYGYGGGDNGTWSEIFYRYADSGFHNCTRFAAFYLERYQGMANPGHSFGHAFNWGLTDAQGGSTDRTSLAERGYAVNGTPRVGAIAWWNRSSGLPFGHVGVVVAVGDGFVHVASDNYATPNGTTDITRYATGAVSAYIHVNTGG